ncbi:MAG: hypothetical protein GY778_03940 [bacterium]|nr:hypothetical protein [bacterium]
MNQRTRFMLAMGAALAGTLCFVAGQPRFDLVSAGTGKYAGIAFFMVSGLLWAAYGLGAGRGSQPD